MQKDLELNVAILLLQYEQQICKKFQGAIRPDVKSLLLHDPLFHTTVHSIISLLNQKDNDTDIYQHLSGGENLRILCDMNIPFSYNEKSRVALIRDGRNNIDFYPTTNKWKDNSDNKMHDGNAHLLIKDGIDF